MMTMDEDIFKTENSPPFDASVRFINALAKADQRYGGYSYELDLSLIKVIKALGLNGEINATPNFIEIALWRGDEDRQTLSLALTRDTNYDLAKLARIRNLIDDVVDKRLSPAQGLDSLQEIQSTPAQYDNFINALAFVLCGTGFAVVIGASWTEVFFGGLLSLISFGITHLASRSDRIEIIKELIAAAIIAIMASVVAMLLPDINPLAVTVCAVIWFVPGFGLTIAPREMLYRNTLSGIIYLTNALIVALKLLGGILIGFAIASSFVPVSVPVLPASAPTLWAWVFVPLLVIGLAILFRAMPRTIGLVMVGGWLVWAGVELGNTMGFWQGTFFGAITLIIFAKFSSSKLKVPSSCILLPGIMILVPGYAFLRALYITNTQGLSEGVIAGFQVLIIIAAIIAGQFIGDAISSSAAFNRMR